MTGFMEDSTLPHDALVLLSLPPLLFNYATFGDQDSIGVFFASYKEPTLFPVRNIEQQGKIYSSQRKAIASVVVAATIGSGFKLMDLEFPIEIFIRTNSLMGTFKV